MPELSGADNPISLFHDRLAVRDNQCRQDQENAHDHHQLKEREAIPQSTPASGKRHPLKWKSH
jgi:hypothetical protein